MSNLSDRIQAANQALLVEGDLGPIPEFFASDYNLHTTRGEIVGHEPVRRFISAIWKAFPDLQVQIEILVEARDRISWQREFRGTHKAAFQGFPPTGREVVWRDMITSRIHGDLIAEEWSVTDLAEQLLRSRKQESPP